MRNTPGFANKGTIMTDTPQQQTEQPASGKRGRPKGKRLVGRGPLRQKLREPLREPIRDDYSHANFVYQPFANMNPLHIDAEILRNIEYDYGYRLQWNAETVLGQPQEQSMASHRRNGFQEVRKGSFGGM